jgi:hypothetical protein
VTDFTIYKGEKFWLQTTGRYFQSGDKTQSERLLHRRIWIDHNGEIPSGYAVHHKDGDWRNNDISNLEIMPIQQHMRLHMLDRWSDERHAARFRDGLKAARNAAKAWHASPEGLAWHSANGKAAWDGRSRVKSLVKCEKCGGDIHTYFLTRTRFCSRKCGRNNSYRVHFSSDRKCAHCGDAFVANKYRKTAFCSRTCSNRARVTKSVV